MGCRDCGILFPSRTILLEESRTSCACRVYSVHAVAPILVCHEPRNRTSTPELRGYVNSGSRRDIVISSGGSGAGAKEKDLPTMDAFGAFFVSWFAPP